jgi:hypothetical protein
MPQQKELPVIRKTIRWWLVLMVVVLARPRLLEAQWSLGVTAAYSDFRGGIRDPSGVTLEPSSRFHIGISATRTLDAWEIAVGLDWAPGHLSSRDSTGESLQLDVLSEGLPRYRLSALVGLRLAEVGPGRLSLLAGPSFDLWHGDDIWRPRLGGQLRLVLEAPMGRLLVRNYLGYSLSGSPFNASDFPPDFARPMLQAISLGVEIGLRL